MQQEIREAFLSSSSSVEFASIRKVSKNIESLAVQKNELQPPSSGQDVGFMVIVINKGGLGYSSSCDVSPDAVKQAVARASDLASESAKYSIHNWSDIDMPQNSGDYETAINRDWSDVSFAEKLELLMKESEAAGNHSDIVSWGSSVEAEKTAVNYLATNGSEINQTYQTLMMNVHSTAYRDGEAQRRSLRGGVNRQGGYELLDKCSYFGAGERIREEALELLAAENCPSEKTELVLAPDQMALQIHESIGHPLELDRILGDERNYAGTSFVTQDMFGDYQYGSDLLNVTFDPTVVDQAATYKFDDTGLKAEKTYIIKDGLLVCPLGGVFSQARAGMDGVANSRAVNWNRPPIDRMANLNVEAGDSSLEEILGAIEDGIMMFTNRSWSIDDSRNKFQFGCEYGRRIRNGKLAEVVKNPNYRGISASFWRSLKMVGNESTLDVFGTPYCGKGEMNQAVQVGHRSPVCYFSGVEVFGGGKS